MSKHQISLGNLINRSIVMQLDPFAFRQFDDPNYEGTKITSMSKEEFTSKINELFNSGKYELKDGYVCEMCEMPTNVQLCTIL